MNRVARILVLLAVGTGLAACTSPTAPAQTKRCSDPTNRACTNIDYINPNIDYINPNV